MAASGAGAGLARQGPRASRSCHADLTDFFLYPKPAPVLASPLSPVPTPSPALDVRPGAVRGCTAGRDPKTK